jgi:hypothetical protein
VPHSRVVILRRLPNLFEPCRRGAIHRRTVVAQLEEICRKFQPDDPYAAIGRDGRPIRQSKGLPSVGLFVALDVALRRRPDNVR